ncbi:serine/threonine protein kinase [Thauera aromatica]|uniref:serine/threonine protein kinase n=1 Tax=Thauera aromatica TaxID=59405 RepID=UPI001FFCA010|nr:protein kinase [Thauera aromatica]MCK2096966.1 protein kinase [Thauera aromatica]
MRRLGTWTPDRRLGGGGYAEAFLCHGPAAPDGAALKVFIDPTHVNTFEREIAALMLVDGGGGTPRLLDHGRDDGGRLCIVTELAPGVRLDRRLRDAGPLPAAVLPAMVRQILATLAVAHDRELLHKDIKASNLLMDGERFVLIDWGVSEPFGDGRAETIRAKQDVVAPECYYGRHGPATDFYALGWLIVHAATAAQPYRFDAIHDPDYRVVAHCLERAELPPTLPAEWRPLVANWIGKRPENRLIGYDLDLLLASAAGARCDAGAIDWRNVGRNTGFLRQAAEAGVPWAQHELGQRALQAGARAQALYWLEQAADAGYARAACRLALALADGERSRAWLADAARAGNAEACYRLARRLLAEGKAQDAAALLKAAAKRGHRKAQHHYAFCVEVADPAAAEAWHRAAIERGLDAAQVRVADKAGA